MSIKFQGFDLISSFHDQDKIFLYFKSNTKDIKCKQCACIGNRNKGYRSSFPLLAKFNDKPVIAKFEKRIVKCVNCNTSTIQEIEDIDSKNQISKTIKSCIIDNLTKHINLNYSTTALLNFVSVTSVTKILDKYKLITPETKKVKAIAVD